MLQDWVALWEANLPAHRILLHPFTNTLDKKQPPSPAAEFYRTDEIHPRSISGASAYGVLFFMRRPLVGFAVFLPASMGARDFDHLSIHHGAVPPGAECAVAFIAVVTEALGFRGSDPGCGFIPHA